jgi:hypothetical protein
MCLCGSVHLHRSAELSRAIRAAGGFKGVGELAEDLAATVAPAWEALWPQLEDAIVASIDGRSGVPTEGELLGGLDDAGALVASQWPPKALVSPTALVAADAFGTGRAEAQDQGGGVVKRDGKLRIVRVGVDESLSGVDIEDLWAGALGTEVFGVANVAAAEWLSRDVLYWVGTAWDHELGASISREALKVLNEGGGRKAVAAALRERLGGRFKRSDAYWEVVGASSLNRARAMGSSYGWEDTGADAYEIVGVPDERQSKICEALDGMVFEVAHAVELRERLLSATDPEDVKQIQPWMKESAVLDLKAQGAAALAAAGLSMPPYHGNCRTTVSVRTF